MNEAVGYVLRLSQARQEVFEERRDTERFAEAVPEFARSRNQLLPVFFLDTDERITHIGDGTRGQRAGEMQRRLNVRGIQSIAPLPLAEVVDAIDPRFAHHLRRQGSRTGLISPKVFDAFIERVRALRPESTAILDRFSQARRSRLHRVPPAARQNLALQKEAVATALSIARLARGELTGWDYDEDASVWPDFISGLAKVRLREDQILAHDLATFPGYSALAHSDVAATAFRNGAREVTVILANRLPLESQTGADLIYYNRTFNCFLMVQYKAMEIENPFESDADEDEVLREAVFRFPDEQFTEELKRMDELLNVLDAHAADDDGADGFRLTSNPFFLKICPRIRFSPDDAALCPGMYLPLDYWKRLREHPTMLGPKGGRRVSYGNVRRYMDNTQFATIVDGGWVGTNLHQSDYLSEVIKKVLESGKAAVIAIDDNHDTRHRRQDEETASPAG